MEDGLPRAGRGEGAQGEGPGAFPLRLQVGQVPGFGKAHDPGLEARPRGGVEDDLPLPGHHVVGGEGLVLAHEKARAPGAFRHLHPEDGGVGLPVDPLQGLALRPGGEGPEDLRGGPPGEEGREEEKPEEA